MKIEIQNLGPIHHFEFDLDKDLHLLYGENNVGKSFAVNVVYSLIKVLLKQRKPNEVNSSEIGFDDYLKTIEHILRETWEEKIIFELNAVLKNTYDTLKPLGESINSKSFINFEIIEYRAKTILNSKGFLTVESVVISPDFKEKLQLFNKPERKVEREIMLRHFHNNSNFEFLRLYFLPASRSGLYTALSGMGEIFASLALYRNFLKSNIELPALSESVSDYFLNLTSINGKDSIDEVHFLANEIERYILKGKVVLNQQNKKIYYNPIGSKDSIDISQTASMISELAPLVLYLKHLFPETDEAEYKGNSLLIIEEPEAHLHPKVQVQLMEIFAELTKHNVKVILTSHSNYMFNQLSNMLLKKEIAPEKVAVYHMAMTDKGSVVLPDMEATAEGIEDHNFAGVAQKLYQERLESYEALNEDADAAE